MNAIARLLREYNLISAAIAATIGFLLVAGVITLSQEAVGALLGLVAAWLLVLRFLVTPVADPVLDIGTVVNANSSRPTGVVVPTDTQVSA